MVFVRRKNLQTLNIYPYLLIILLQLCYTSQAYIERDVQRTSKYQLLLKNHCHRSEILNIKRKSEDTFSDARRLVILNRENRKERDRQSFKFTDIMKRYDREDRID